MTSVRELLVQFQQVQQQRVLYYNEFHAGFKQLLETKAEAAYRQLLQDLTVKFNECSTKVIALEEQLRAADAEDLASLLRTVQNHERDKLRLTLTVQALRTAHAKGNFSWQQEDADVLEPSAANGAGHAAHEHSHEHAQGGCGCGAAAELEPTQAEFNAALAEAMQLLDAAVVGINEALEEVKYALEELDD